MKRTRIYVYTKPIDSNYTAHKGYIPIPSNVRNIKSICPVLHNADGYISLLKEMDEEQILNEMRIEDENPHINTRKVDVSVSPDNSDIKFVLRLTKIHRTKRLKSVAISPKFEETISGGFTFDVYHYEDNDGHIISTEEYKGLEYTMVADGDVFRLVYPPDAQPINGYDTTCTLKIIIEYEEDIENA
jgi:hypothetical protein